MRDDNNDGWLVIDPAANTVAPANETDLDPVVGYVGDNPPTDLQGMAEMMLAKPLAQFSRTVQFLGLTVTDALYHHEAVHLARVPYLNVLRSRREKLMAPLDRGPAQSIVPHQDNRQRIKEALGLAICHIQTGAVPKHQVLDELKATLAELDTPPLPPAA